MNNTALLLQRVTTRYVPVEDRVQLLAESANGVSVGVWAGQQAFALDAALQALTPQPQVKCSGDTLALLPVQVNLSALPQHFSWVFVAQAPDGASTPSVELRLDAQACRQWLTLLHRLWTEAGWPSGVWPAWWLLAVSALSGCLAVH